MSYLRQFSSVRDVFFITDDGLQFAKDAKGSNRISSQEAYIGSVNCTYPSAVPESGTNFVPSKRFS